MRLHRSILPLLVSLALLAGMTALAQDSDDPSTFTGTVVERTSDHIKVSRVLQGKTETRVFKMTADTKVEGRLRTGERANVRYTAGADGDVATLVIVRETGNKKKGT